MKHQPLKRLGEGAFGVVISAVDRETQRFVAVKRVKLRRDAPKIEENFQREIEIQARFDHPNIVRVYGAGVDSEGRRYIEMQLVEGSALSAKLGDDTMRRAEVAVRLIATVARAVDYANRLGVVHRDLKPGNILIDARTGAPLVTDFGVAALLELPDTETAIAGTVPYMAPEQCGYQPNGGPCEPSAETDVFGLGVVLYELLTGVRPYEDPTASEAAMPDTSIAPTELAAGPEWRWTKRKALFEAGVEPPPLRKAAPLAFSLGRRLDAELERIVAGALRIDRYERYPSALAFALDLERWLHDLPVHGPKNRPSFRQHTVRFLRRNRLLTFFIVSLLALMAVGWVRLHASIAARERAELTTNQNLAELGARNLVFSTREAKQYVVGLARDEFVIRILRERLPPTGALEEQTPTWEPLITSLKRSGADQFYVLNADGCIVRYWPLPAPPDVYRWYGFRHYFECPMLLNSRVEACIARVFSSEYDQYANTLRMAISAPVYDADGKTLLGVFVATWPADRTLGTLTFGPMPGTKASTSVLLLRDHERSDAMSQLKRRELRPPACPLNHDAEVQGAASMADVFAALERSPRALVVPRDGLGTESIVEFADIEAAASTSSLTHYEDPRDGSQYLASFSRDGMRQFRAASEGRKVEATPVVIAATRRDQLDLEALRDQVVAGLLSLTCLGLGAGFVIMFARRDNEKVRG